MNWIIGLLSGCCVTLTFASLSPQDNTISPERTSASSLYSADTVMTAPVSPYRSDNVIQSGFSLISQSSELVTVTVCSPPSTSNINSAGSTDIEYSLASCVILTSACLSPHLNVAVPIRISLYGFSSTIIFTVKPFSPFCWDVLIQCSSDENSQSSELVTVTSFSSPAAI